MSLGKTLWNLYRRQLKKIPEDERYFFAWSNLVLIVTSRCNFYCRHCLRDLTNTKDLPFEIAQKAVLSARKYNFRSVCLTGGEPLLYPHLKELIELIVREGYVFSVVTNGFLFKQFADFFKGLRDKMSFAAFSLESVDPEKHDAIRQKGSFEKLLEDFRICRENRIPFRIITAASTKNFDEMFDIALFAKKKGAKVLVLTTVLPCPRSESNELVLSPAQRQELFLGLRRLSRTLKFPIFIGADIRANNNIRLCNNVNMTELAIDMEGNVVQCCEMANYDSPEIHAKSIIASLKEGSFEDALAAFSEHMHRFTRMRIQDYQSQPDTKDIDFNSCFYCINRLPRL